MILNYGVSKIYDAVTYLTMSVLNVRLVCGRRFLLQLGVMLVLFNFQEELKILRLRYAMLIQEEIEIRDKDLNQTLDHKRRLKVNKTSCWLSENIEIYKICMSFYNLQCITRMSTLIFYFLNPGENIYFITLYRVLFFYVQKLILNEIFSN